MVRLVLYDDFLSSSSWGEAVSNRRHFGKSHQLDCDSTGTGWISFDRNLFGLFHSHAKRASFSVDEHSMKPKLLESVASFAINIPLAYGYTDGIIRFSVLIQAFEWINLSFWFCVVVDETIGTTHGPSRNVGVNRSFTTSPWTNTFFGCCGMYVCGTWMYFLEAQLGC